MEGAGENSSWPTGGATNPFGHGWNRKMNGLSVVEAGSSGQKTLADVTEECELMRCMDNKYKFIPSLVFQLEESVPGSAYSVKISWIKRHSGLGSLSQPHEFAHKKKSLPTHRHTIHLLSLWLASFLLLLRS